MAVYIQCVYPMLHDTHTKDPHSFQVQSSEELLSSSQLPAAPPCLPDYAPSSSDSWTPEKYNIQKLSNIADDQRVESTYMYVCSYHKGIRETQPHQPCRQMIVQRVCDGRHSCY